MSEFLGPFETMLAGLFPQSRLREIDAGADWSRERAEVERSGFVDAMLAETVGGPGLALHDVAALWMALGRHAAPLEIGRAMIERAALSDETFRRLLIAAAIAGAADRVLAMTADHANQRVQFGKPIGRQQALQQQLAVMAEQVVAMRLAVELAASGEGGPSLSRAAVAKTVTALYAPAVANTAHAVHGAIGISAEHDLQLYTRRLHQWRLEGGSETLWARNLGRALLVSDAAALDWMRAELFA